MSENAEGGQVSSSHLSLTLRRETRHIIYRFIRNRVKNALKVKKKVREITRAP